MPLAYGNFVAWGVGGVQAANAIAHAPHDPPSEAALQQPPAAAEQAQAAAEATDSGEDVSDEDGVGAGGDSSLYVEGNGSKLTLGDDEGSAAAAVADGGGSWESASGGSVLTGGVSLFVREGKLIMGQQGGNGAAGVPSAGYDVAQEDLFDTMRSADD